MQTLPPRLTVAPCNNRDQYAVAFLPYQSVSPHLAEAEIWQLSSSHRPKAARYGEPVQGLENHRLEQGVAQGTANTNRVAEAESHVYTTFQRVSRKYQSVYQ